jgi:8-amino-7-oxononanoate synthase
MVDDAHGIGVCGDEGRGSCHAHQVTPDILIVTFGKGLA